MVTLWINTKPNKDFDMSMTGSQEVLFWYERTIISLQFFINLMRRKYFKIPVTLVKYEHKEGQQFRHHVIVTQALCLGQIPRKSFFPEL